MHEPSDFLLRARRVLTMTPGRPPIEDGAVLVRSGTIAAVGPWRELRALAPADARDIGQATLLPAPLNAHTHLELSHLALPDRPFDGYLDWVRWLVAQPVADFSPEAVRAAIGQLTGCGTGAVADIATRRGQDVAALLARHPIDYVSQHEIFGYSYDETSLAPAPAPRLSLAGHALYSTAPRALQLAKQWDTAHGRTFSLHLAEHEGEVRLLADGSGEFADFMRLRILPKDFAAPGLTPTAWGHALGLLDSRTLAVHCVRLTAADMALLAASQATACLCPRSNRVIGVGRAPVRALLDAGVPCCLGTDSLASSPDLNIWRELLALLEFCPLPEADALALLTRNPARALGFTALGQLAPGMAARLATLPADVEDALRD